MVNRRFHLTDAGVITKIHITSSLYWLISGIQAFDLSKGTKKALSSKTSKSGLSYKTTCDGYANIESCEQLQTQTQT